MPYINQKKINGVNFTVLTLDNKLWTFTDSVEPTFRLSLYSFIHFLQPAVLQIMVMNSIFIVKHMRDNCASDGQKIDLLINGSDRAMIDGYRTSTPTSQVNVSLITTTSTKPMIRPSQIERVLRLPLMVLAF